MLHVRPASVETSTRAMSASPAHAKPRNWIEDPMGTVAPSSGLVKMDFTFNAVYGTVSFGSTIVPGATGRFGIRYAVCMKKPLASASETRILVIHFRSEERRVGKECRSWWTADQ